MEWFQTVLIVPLFLIAALALSFMLYAARHHLSPAAIPFAGIMLAIIIWTSAYAFQLGSSEPASQLFWLRVSYIGIVAIPALYVVFATQFSDPARRIPPAFLSLLLLEPVVILTLVWLGGDYGLFFEDFTQVFSGPVVLIVPSYGPAYWIHAAYSYGLIILGTFIFIHNLDRHSAVFRGRLTIILLSLVIFASAHAATALHLTPLPYLDMTPYSLLALELTILWGILHFQFLEITNIAQQAIIQKMDDALLVLDLRERVVFANQVAGAILGLAEKDLLGKPAAQVWPEWDELKLAPLGSRKSAAQKARSSPFPPDLLFQQDVTYGEGNTERSYRLTVSSLHNQAGMRLGRLVAWKDITYLRQSDELRRWGQEHLIQLVDNSPNPIFAVNRQKLIQLWNTACEANFQFGKEINGQSYHQILEASQRLWLDEKLAWIFEHGQTISDLDIDYRCRDGITRHMASRIYPLLDKDGAAELVIFANTDITDRKKAQETLQRQYEELRVLHSVALACVSATNEDMLIETVTGIIGDTFFPDNFGVLLVDERNGTLCRHSSYRERSELPGAELPLGEGLCSKAILERCTLRIADVSLEPAYYQVDPSTCSELCVPLNTVDHVFGVLNAESAELNGFSETDERLLTILAGQLSSTIERLRASAAEQQRVQELTAITRVSREISSVLDVNEVLNSIARYAAEISSSDASGLFLYQADERLKMVAAYGVGEEFIQLLQDQGVYEEGSAVGNAIRLRRPYQIPDVSIAPAYSMQHTARMENIRSILALPMQSGDKIIGGIVIWNRKTHKFSEEEERFLQALANQSVNAVENARLFEAERKRLELAEALRETGSALSSQLDFNSLLDGFLEQLEKLVPYDAANVMLVERGAIRVARARGYEKFGQDFSQKVYSLSLSVQSTPNIRRVLETRQPQIVPDIQEDPHWIRICQDSPTRSWAGAPIIIQGEVAAIFSLDKITPNFYLPEHAERLEIYAGQAGLALQNSRLFEETQRRLREVTLLSKMIQLTATATDIQSALRQICKEVADFFHTEQAAFLFFDPDYSACQVLATYPSTLGAQFEGANISLAKLQPLIKAFVEKREPLAFPDIQEITALARVEEMIDKSAIKSAILVPIALQNTVAAFLGVAMPERREYDRTDYTLMKDVANQVGQSLERLNLFVAAQNQAQQMASLAEISRELNRPLTVEEVVSGIGQGAMTLSKADRAAVFLRQPDDTAVCAWCAGLSNAYIQQVTQQLAQVPGGQLISNADPVLIPDIQHLPEDALLRKLAQGESYQAVGLWPLVYEGSVVAVVGLYHDTPHEWDNSPKEILLAFTRQATIALQNARLFTETKRRAIQMEALNKIIAEAVKSPDLAYLVETVLDLTCQALNTEIGGLWVSGHSAVRGISPEIGRQESEIAHSDGLSFQSTVAVNDWRQIDPVKSPMARLMEMYQVRATLSVPVLAGGRRIGGLGLGTSAPRTWQPEEIKLVEAIGQQVGSAAERLALLKKTQEQAQQVQRIIDTVPEGVVLLDASRKIILANPAAQECLSALLTDLELDQPLSHLAGQPISEFVNHLSETNWRELQCADEKNRTFELASRPLEIQNLNAGWVLVIRDVTDERANLARIQMQERLATVGQLAAGIAHDFNNIMAAIVVYNDLMAIDPGLNANHLEHVKIIQQQTQRATSLIRQILDFSRRSIMEPSPLDLLPFIKELDKLLERILPETILLRFSYQPGSYMIKADPASLQQVFMNLALNARDAMLSEGILKFSLDRLDIREGERPPLPELTAGEWIRLTISDQGVGIPEDILPHIFDPFYTTKPAGKGTGLGLAQVYGIIKQHGGSIDVQSEVGKGSLFSLYFPALMHPEQRPAVSSAEPIQGGNQETVLLVEDDPSTREALHYLLESQNFHVLTAENGLEALQIYDLRRQDIQLVISDIVMPNMGGLSLYEALQARDSKIRMLFITGHPLELENQYLLEQSPAAWLQKPFSLADFMNTVQQVLVRPS